MTPETQPRFQFYAMPDSPHLTASACGYTLLTLNGLSTWTTAKEVERITINGIERQVKPLGDRTLMLIPDFRQEAQVVKVYCFGDATEPRPTAWRSATGRIAPGQTPDFSTGLSPATHNRYKKGP